MREELLKGIRKEASASGVILTASEEAQLLATASADLTVKETYVADISFATRLQVEWPRAVNMFKRNPVLGGGASSITEATDGDYFRWIGEFGLFGTLSFFYILYLIISSLWKFARKNTDESLLYYGFIFGFIGLFINASYIDVFEASKVAFTFWTVAGIFIGSLSINNSKEKV
jgi:O-antigen ligase